MTARPSLTADKFGELIRSRYNSDPNGYLGTDAKTFIQSPTFNIQLKYDTDGQTWTEQYIGTNFGSTTDHGDRWNTIQSNENNKWSKDGAKTAETLIEEVRQRISKHPRQINFYDSSNDNVYTGVIIRLTESGYSIYPDENSTV
jgi:hypothetical protein